jgi:hypothetical protein
MLSSNMLLLNFILRIKVTFSTPTPANNSYRRNHLRLDAKEEPPRHRAAVLCGLTRGYFAATIVS